MTKEFGVALEKWLEGCKRVSDAYYERNNFTNLTRPTFEGKSGKKFVKVIRKELISGPVHSFIDMSNGDIYKPASWNARAKHVRGNIFKNEAEQVLDENGFVRYLR